MRSVFANLCVAVSCLPAAAGLNAARAQTSASVPASLPQTRPASPATVASHVPGDVRLYAEVRDPRGISRYGAGAGLAGGVLAGLRPRAATTPAATAGPGWGLRQLFAQAVGLDDPGAIDLLFSGPLGVAADGWSGLSDAVLVAWPNDPAALAGALAARLVPATVSGKVRRYALAHDHELACDGRSAVVGRPGKRTSLYARTLDLLERGGGASLADQPEFRERTASLAADSQLIVYVGKAAGAAAGQDPLTAWWPEDWPWLETVALGLALGGDGLTVKVSGRLDPDGPPLTRSEPPIQVLRRLPPSVIAAWTQAIDYVGTFRRLRTQFSHDPEGFHFDALEAGLESGTIEKRLLGHLVGDTVLLIDQVTVKPLAATDDAETLILPTAAVVVETDDPDAVAAALAPVMTNVVRLVNGQLPAASAVALRSEPVAPGGPTMHSVAVGRVLGGNTKCDLLHALDLSAVVADRWLVVATDPRTLRQIVAARRGAAEPLPVGDLDRIVEQVALRGGQPRRVLYAQPRSAGQMIDSWIRHISAHHPEMLQPQWWEKLLRRQRAMGKQLGILGRPADGAVEVVDSLPGSAARGLLQTGDRILAVDGIKVDPAAPLKSLRENIAARKLPDRITLLVRRGDKPQEITLPLPGESPDAAIRSPVELLGQFAALSRLFGSASYVLWQPRPDVVDARIDLRYTASTQPAAH
ncbi:MAG: PDZ domain-containing protein [Planctomycetes bacterium]|nr:PDZ domain-containing protein [Planctomycetota bacterium]